MSDLLEDPDGAPYPQEIQDVLDWLERGIDDLDAVDARRDLVEALEAVAANAWDRGLEDGTDWVERCGHVGPLGPPDPPRNPHERGEG